MRDETRQDSGEATVEFLALTVAILIPLTYFVLTLAAVQATVFATEAAARETARILSHDHTQGLFAQRQADQIFADYGVSSSYYVTPYCQPMPCGASSTIHVEVHATVPLPLIPDAWADSLDPVPVISHVAMPVTSVKLSP
ncbi:MAG: 1-hydroxy-2-methyl-2-(E)-butenyl 4-diphosphate synthase [Actinomycetaceae bacterium]|nr:1-hydroxy-2-methyl-2-(E)-butenyl 4-diphosphate synthase [Actinomycetaceae bacterium]